MTLAAYIALTNWTFPVLDDPRGFVRAGSIILLDDATQAPSALALGAISATPPSLSGGQISALATANLSSYSRLGSRAPAVIALGLT